MKKIFCWLLLLNFLSCSTPAFAKHNINVYVEKIEAGYQFKTVLKHYQPYYLTLVNNGAERVYLSSKSEIKYITKSGEIKSVPNDEEIFVKSKKNEMARYFFIAAPCAGIGGFITGASFFLLTLPGLGILVAGNMPYRNAINYNSSFAEDFYANNYMPIVLIPGEIKKAYVFLPKKDEAAKLLITNLLKDNSGDFDLEIQID